jgi:hypothetical protein
MHCYDDAGNGEEEETVWRGERESEIKGQRETRMKRNVRYERNKHDKE